MQHRINSPAVISESLDGEVVIIDLQSGVYYSLRGSGARIWDAFAAGSTVEEVLEDVEDSYDTTGADPSGDLDRFVKHLVEAGLLVPGQAPDTPGARPAPVEPSPWVAPELETFTDMQDLLLLDPVHEVAPGEGWPVAIADDDG